MQSSIWHGYPRARVAQTSEARGVALIRASYIAQTILAFVWIILADVTEEFPGTIAGEGDWTRGYIGHAGSAVQAWVWVQNVARVDGCLQSQRCDSFQSCASF